MAKDSLAFYFIFFLPYVGKHSASRPKTPSADTINGVNEARRTSAAPLYICISS